MTPQQIEEMNQLATDHAFSGNYSNNNNEAGDAYKSFEAGYKAAMEKAKVLEDALDWYAQTGEGAYSQAHLYLRAKEALSKYRGDG